MYCVMAILRAVSHSYFDGLPVSKSLRTAKLLNMCWESFPVVRFDLGPLVQGQTAVAKLKSAHISLIIGPIGLGCENNL